MICSFSRKHRLRCRSHCSPCVALSMCRFLHVSLFLAVACFQHCLRLSPLSLDLVAAYPSALDGQNSDIILENGALIVEWLMNLPPQFPLSIWIRDIRGSEILVKCNDLSVGKTTTLFAGAAVELLVPLPRGVDATRALCSTHCSHDGGACIRQPCHCYGRSRGYSKRLVHLLACLCIRIAKCSQEPQRQSLRF